VQTQPAGAAKNFLLAGLYRDGGESAKAEEQWKTLERLIDAGRESSGAMRPGETAAQACPEREYAACAELLSKKKSLIPREQLTLGQALLNEGEDARAADAFAAALTAERWSAEPAYWLAYTSMKLGEANWDRLLAAYPDSWHAYELRGQAAELSAEHPEAIKQYQMAIRLHPNDPELYEGLGHAYFVMRSYRQAEDALKAALRLDPTRADALATLGGLYLDEHQDQKALPYLQAAVRYEPRLLEAHAALGRAYMRAGEASLAAPELEKAASIDLLGDVHFLLYRAYLQLGEKDRAQKALERSQELRKNSLNVPGSMSAPGQ
ncbi:MAG: tetratricopeptide repeat protein, partial [Terriglobia bacterium]